MFNIIHFFLFFVFTLFSVSIGNKNKLNRKENPSVPNSDLANVIDSEHDYDSDNDSQITSL